MQAKTLNDVFVKYIDFGSEEYAKDLVIQSNPGLELSIINPFCGVIKYPSDQFLNNAQTYFKTIQFQNSHYVGWIEMFLPKFIAPVDTGLSYTLLKFNLDGVDRSFLQVSEANVVSQGIKFKDFINGLFPTAGDVMPFNRNGWHILTNIEISGGRYLAQGAGDPFGLSQSGVGAYTPAIEFEFSVSGYRAIML